MTAAAVRHLLCRIARASERHVDQVQLVAAFRAWSLDKAMSLADQLVARGDLDADAEIVPIVVEK
jgi:hypothetical protein